LLHNQLQRNFDLAECCLGIHGQLRHHGGPSSLLVFKRVGRAGDSISPPWRSTTAVVSTMVKRNVVRCVALKTLTETIFDSGSQEFHSNSKPLTRIPHAIFINLSSDLTPSWGVFPLNDETLD
jgi:hypothetical protein